MSVVFLSFSQFTTTGLVPTAWFQASAAV